MIKTFESFTNTTTYYNSHGNWSTFAKIREIEVDERENYPIEEFNEWQEKYDIKDNDQVIWVTPNKNMAFRYLFPAEEWEQILEMPIKKVEKKCRREYGDCDLYEVTDKEGFIIPDSDDGEEGYLFVWRKQ